MPWLHCTTPKPSTFGPNGHVARDPAAVPVSGAAAAGEGGCLCPGVQPPGAAGPPQLCPFAVIVLYKTLPQVLLGDAWCWGCAYQPGSVG